jgi:hypothetical protein
MPVSFRFATKQDVALLLKFIRALAEYEHMLDKVVASEEILGQWLFEKGIAEAFFVLEEEKEVGFALYFHNFSTFLGRGGIYLEDLFVLPRTAGAVMEKRFCGGWRRLRWIALRKTGMGLSRLESAEY